MIKQVNREFTTGVNNSLSSFARGNSGAFIQELITIAVDFNYINDFDDQIIINSLTSLKLVTGLWDVKPFKPSDSVNVQFITISPAVTVNEIKIILSVVGNIITFTTPMTGISAPTVGKILPSDTGGGFVSMTNGTIYSAKQISIKHNLIENSNSFNLSSIIDGNENVFLANDTDIMSVGSTITMNRVGLISGGGYFLSTLKRIADVSSFKMYEILLKYYAPDFKDNLSEPDWFIGIKSLKPVYQINALPIAYDPNYNIIFKSNNLSGNIGWIDEWYNGGFESFNVSLFEIKGIDGTVIDNIDHTQKCSITVEVDSYIQIQFFCLKFNIIPPTTDLINNYYSIIQNSLTSTYYNNGIGYTQYNKGGDKSEISNVVAIITPLKTTITFDVEFNATAITYIDSLSDKLIRLDGTFISKGGSAGSVLNNESTILFWEGSSELQPLEDGDYELVNYSKFYEHEESLIDAGHEDYDGCTEDDILYATEFEVDIFEDYNYRTFQTTVFVQSTVTGEKFNLLNRVYNFADFVRDGGVTHFNINNDLNQFLDGDDRDFFRLNTTLILTGKYRVNLVWSFFSDWRFWVNLADALPYFYNPLLPNNGMNREWMRYLRDSDFEILLENKITTLDDQEFKWGGSIDLQDYEFNLAEPVINTTIKIFTPALVEIFEFPETGLTRVEARHTLIAGSWNFDNTWGWIKIRPLEGEPSKLISTHWDWQVRNKPLRPRVGFIKATLDFVTPTVCVVSCDIDSADLTALNNTLVARIQTEALQEPKKMNVNLAQFKLNELPELLKREDRGLELCSRPFKVLAHPSDDTTWKNDVTGLAFKFDSMTVYLEKNGVHTLATGFVVEFPHQDDAVGYVIDWRQLQSGGVLLSGCYRIRVDYVKGGGSGSFYYGSYNLVNYNITTSEGDARIYAILDDYVRADGINYRDSGFRNSVRFDGMFGWMQPNYDIENIIKINRTREKVRNESLRTYTLESSYALSCLTDKIDHKHLLAASHIFISDYNKTNHKQYRDFPVILDEQSSPEYDYAALPFAKIKTQFLDKKALWESKFSGKSGIDQPKFGLEPISLGGGGGGGACLPASYQLRYEDNTPISSGTIASGLSDILYVPDPINCPTYNITPRRENLLQPLSGNIHDEYWHKVNGTYNITLPSNPITQRLDKDDVTKVYYDDSADTGIAHKVRYVGYKGGYYQESDSTYRTIEGALSTFNEEFLKSGGIYIIDRLYWFGWRGVRGGSASTIIHLNNAPYSFSGFTNFWIPTTQQLDAITNRLEFIFPRENPPFDIQLQLSTCTYNYNSTAVFNAEANGTTTLATPATSRVASYVRPHIWGTDDLI